MGPRISDVPAAILAGGLARRLGAVTETTPKALVEVAGRPFVDHQLLLLHRHGIRRIVFCVGHFGAQIERHVGHGPVEGLSIRYSFDGDRLLGTAGALRRALPFLGDVFFVMYGDSYMDVPYADILDNFARTGAMALMTVFRNDDRWDKSNAEFSDGRLVAYDKRQPSARMKHIDYGVAVLSRAALERVPPDQPFDLADLYRELVDQGSMVGYEVSQRFYEIGSHAGLEETRRYLAGVAGSHS
jgi:N-acetyl-alpha-D-muramate 1-phosphate uridylyltransferase